MYIIYIYIYIHIYIHNTIHANEDCEGTMAMCNEPKKQWISRTMRYRIRKENDCNLLVTMKQTVLIASCPIMEYDETRIAEDKTRIIMGSYC